MVLLQVLDEENTRLQKLRTAIQAKAKEFPAMWEKGEDEPQGNAALEEWLAYRYLELAHTFDPHHLLTDHTYTAVFKELAEAAWVQSGIQVCHPIWIYLKSRVDCKVAAFSTRMNVNNGNYDIQYDLTH